MRITRAAWTLATAVLVTAGMTLAVAPGAAADQTWTQSFQRSGPAAPCDAPKALDIVWQDGWTGSPEWTPTWEQWPNNGAGGWTCTRSITWAKDAPMPTYPSIHCVQGSPTEWVDFLGGFNLPIGSPDYVADPTCTTPTGVIGFNIVYAPEGPSQAEELCQVAFGVPMLRGFNFDVYACGVL